METFTTKIINIRFRFRLLRIHSYTQLKIDRLTTAKCYSGMPMEINVEEKDKE